MARRVGFTASRHIVSIVANLVPEQDFSGADILIPSTGTTMTRAKARKGETMQMPVMHLQTKFLFDVIQWGGPYQWEGLPDTKKVCQVCEAARSAGVPEQAAAVQTDDAFVCCRCLLSWHAECVDAAFVKKAVAEALLTGSLNNSEQETQPTAFCCPFCF